MWVIKVVFQQDPGIRLEGRVCGRTDVESIIFGPGLKQEPLRLEVRDFEPFEEVSNQVCCDSESFAYTS